MHFLCIIPLNIGLHSLGFLFPLRRNKMVGKKQKRALLSSKKLIQSCLTLTQQSFILLLFRIGLFVVIVFKLQVKIGMCLFQVSGQNCRRCVRHIPFEIGTPSPYRQQFVYSSKQNISKYQTFYLNWPKFYIIEKFENNFAFRTIFAKCEMRKAKCELKISNAKCEMAKKCEICEMRNANANDIPVVHMYALFVHQF